MISPNCGILSRCCGSTEILRKSNPIVLTFTLISLYSLDFWAVALYRMMTYNTPIQQIGNFFSLFTLLQPFSLLFLPPFPLKALPAASEALPDTPRPSQLPLSNKVNGEKNSQFVKWGYYRSSSCTGPQPKNQGYIKILE